MNYEQKYKQALERARKIHNQTEFDYEKGMMEEIFSELNESYGEKIRKELIEHIKANYEADYVLFKKFSPDDVIAWLEKQSNQNLNPVFDIEIPFGAKDSELQETSYYIPEGFHAEIDGNKVVIKRVEKKPTDKVKPKFKPEDWIIDDETPNDVFCVIEVLEEIYKVIDIDGDDYHIPHCKTDKQFHLWTIQDAKIGDVLVHNNCTFIFMGIKNGIVNALEEKLLCDTTPVYFGEPDKNNDYHPATRKQIDTLFAKIKEAGYKWDNERKELKKIKQNNTDEYIETKGLYEIEAEAEELANEISDEKHNLTEFECALVEVCRGWIGEEIGWKEYIKSNADALIKIVIKKLDSVQDSSFKQKPTWNEEDEGNIS